MSMSSSSGAAPSVVAPSPIGRRLVVCLGLSQLIAWGTMHYLIAVVGQPIASELGWDLAFVNSGFALALVVMGASSGLAGRWINRRGGRLPLMAGCWCGALGCVLMAATEGRAQYLAAWLLLGLGMRLALYDAAFAALAWLGGAESKRAMSQITLFGGLASTAFWPLGQALVSSHGWRSALLCYAGFLLLASALHRALPAERPAAAAPAAATDAGSAATGRGTAPLDTALFGLIAVLTLVMQTGIAAHFLNMLRGLGWDAATAVTLSTLLGIGQLGGRGWVVLQGHRFDTIRLNLLPCAVLAAAFAIALAWGGHLAGAAAFAFFYGMGNGIATITRGAMPLRLFDPAHYGRIVGAILRPAFLLSAGAPIALAWTMQRLGLQGTLWLAVLVSVLLLAAAVALAWRHPPPSTAARL